jgi:hypothetical protein
VSAVGYVDNLGGSNSRLQTMMIEEYRALLRVGTEVRRLAGLIEAAHGTRLVPWLTSHPMRALRLADDWDRLLATVKWIEQRQAPGMYLRQVDAPGVDTKFIERHKGVLTELLDAQLDSSRVAAGVSDFAGRYGFLRRPGYVRFRVVGGFRGFSELSARADEFTSAPGNISRVYVIENEITYLAFPVPVGAMVIFGGGYAVPVLEPLGWLVSMSRTGGTPTRTASRSLTGSGTTCPMPGPFLWTGSPC